eukprot:Gb_17748 [translate_table: standard]
MERWNILECRLEYSYSSIESIQIVYALKGSSGEVLKVSAPKRGGGGRFKSATVGFKESEILTGISGYFGYRNGYRDDKHFVIKSLSFHTNLQVYGPYGVEAGTYFESPSSAGKIVGFFGRSGTLLDSIGIYTFPTNNNFAWPGPWGGPNGDKWSDGTYSSVTQINLVCSSSSIKSIQSIQIVYALKSPSGAVLKVSAPRRGGDGDFTDKVQFKENEILTGISGYYGRSDQKHSVVQSLSFRTNLQDYGPYGVEAETYFESPSSAGKIVGFFGRSGTLLDAIGIYTLPN